MGRERRGHSGATNSSHTTPVLQPEDSGTNLFSVEVYAGAIITNSDTADLVVATPPPPNTYYSQVVSNDAPVLYWNFDEAKGNAIQQMPVPASPTTANDLVPALGAHRAVHATIGSGLLLGYCAEFNGSDNFNAATPSPSESGLTMPLASNFGFKARAMRLRLPKPHFVSLALVPWQFTTIMEVPVLWICSQSAGELASRASSSPQVITIGIT